MSDSTSTTEGTASTDSGTTDAGTGALDPATSTGTGAQPDAGALASQLEAADRRARDEQSRADRLQAQLDKLQAPPAPPSDSQQKPAEGLTLAEIRAELRRDREFALAESTLKGQYGSADPGLFRDAADRFDSVEAFTAAVEESHRSIEQRVAAAKEAAEQELRAKYAEQYGPLEPDVNGTEAQGDGIPTLAQLHRMSLAEQDALEAKHPGIIDRIIETASRKEG